MESPRPFDDLDPERVLTALESAGFKVEARVLQLNSFENRVYQVGLADGAFVVAKFYRPGRWSDAAIHEEHAFCIDLAGADLPVVPPLRGPDDPGAGPVDDAGADTAAAGDDADDADGDDDFDDDFDDDEPFDDDEDDDRPDVDPGALFHHGDYRFSVSPRRGGRAPSTDDPQVRAALARYIARIHVVGARHRFRHRPTLDVASYGHASRTLLLDGDFVPMDVRRDYEDVSAALLEQVERAFAGAGRIRHIRLHGDCHLGNVLWRDDAPHFVDFDDARNGPAIQDLWMLLSGDSDEQRGQLVDLLAEYRTIRDIDPAEARLVEPLRALRMMHHSAWIARRWADPAFPAAFPGFAGPRWWGTHLAELREQLWLLQRSD